DTGGWVACPVAAAEDRDAVTGNPSNGAPGPGPPGSGQRSVTAAARLPPALSPPTASRPGSTPSPAACAATHSTAAAQSSTAAGNFHSGANRYPGVTTTHPAALARLRQIASEVSMLPSAQPPPNKYTNAGSSRSPDGRYRRTGSSPAGPGKVRSTTSCTGSGSPATARIAARSASRACSTVSVYNGGTRSPRPRSPTAPTFGAR